MLPAARWPARGPVGVRFLPSAPTASLMHVAPRPGRASPPGPASAPTPSACPWRSRLPCANAGTGALVPPASTPGPRPPPPAATRRPRTRGPASHRGPGRGWCGHTIVPPSTGIRPARSPLSRKRGGNGPGSGSRGPGRVEPSSRRSTAGDTHQPISGCALNAPMSRYRAPSGSTSSASTARTRSPSTRLKATVRAAGRAPTVPSRR